MSGALPQRPSNLKDTVQVKLTVFTFRVLKPNISSKGHPCELGFSPSMPRSPIIGLLSPVARSLYDCYYLDISTFLLLLTKFIIFFFCTKVGLVVYIFLILKISKGQYRET